MVRRSRTLQSLTAASQVVESPADVYRKTNMGTPARVDDWQTEAWDCYDLVGELRYVVGWLAASCSRVRLVGSDINPETGLPTGSTENTRVNEMVRSIADGPLGQSQYQKRSVPQLVVAGEYWSVIIADQPTGKERWLVIGRDELRRAAGKVEIELPEGGWHEMDFANESMFRVWNPHPKRAQLPDSPVRAVLDPLHEIIRTTRKIRAADNSRLIGNGLLLLPQEMNLPSVSFPGIPGQPQASQPNMSAVQQLQELLWQVAVAASDDTASSTNSSLVPVMATVPGEQVKNIQHISFGMDVSDTEIKKRNDAISRLAMGMDISPEQLLGLSQGNHWSSWMIGDQDVNLHIDPIMATICQAINSAVFAPALQAEGLDPTKFTLWYDTSELTADPDKTNDAEAAWAAGTIRAEAYIRYRGLDADSVYDFASMEGWQQWAIDRACAHPELLVTLAPLLPEPISDIIAEANALPPELPVDDGTGDGSEVPADQQQAPPDTETNPPPDQNGQPAQQAARIRASEFRRELVWPRGRGN
jgi:hypothetical protein